MTARQRLSYANVMATLAMFIALGGAANAISLPRGSVDARALAKNAVRSAEIKNRQVRSADIRKAAIGASHLSSGLAAELAVASTTLVTEGVPQTLARGECRFLPGLPVGEPGSAIVGVPQFSTAPEPRVTVRPLGPAGGFAICNDGDVQTSRITGVLVTTVEAGA